MLWVCINIQDAYQQVSLCYSLYNLPKAFVQNLTFKKCYIYVTFMVIKCQSLQWPGSMHILCKLLEMKGGKIGRKFKSECYHDN